MGVFTLSVTYRSIVMSEYIEVSKIRLGDTSLFLRVSPFALVFDGKILFTIIMCYM